MTDDYTSGTGEAQFAAATGTGTQTQQVPFSTVEDQQYEGDETVNVNITTLTPTCSGLGTLSTAVVTIEEDDCKYYIVAGDILETG